MIIFLFSFFNPSSSELLTFKFSFLVTIYFYGINKKEFQKHSPYFQGLHIFLFVCIPLDFFGDIRESEGIQYWSFLKLELEGVETLWPLAWTLD